MKYALTENLSKIEIAQIIENAWELEARRDIDGAIDNFSPIWSNVEKNPDFSEFEIDQQAQLYRLSGFFLSIYGNVRSQKSFQERAKDVIWKSAEIFITLDDKYGLADAQNVLAVCYFNEGNFQEAETILEHAVDNLIGDYLNPIYLRNRLNLLQNKHKLKKFQEAIVIIEDCKIPMEFCDDFRTCALFHEKAGLIYRSINQFEKAVWHYNESIKFAYKINNFLFICTERNNLAFLYNKINNFELAHFNIDEALRLARQNNFIGSLSNYLDTQALIFANEGYPEIALQKIDEAISLFQKGDDYYGLTESIWNKCKFLFQLDQNEAAVLLFTELISIAGQRMGEFAVKQFSKEFSELIHIKQEGLSLDDNIKRFKKNEIVNAIHKSNYNLYDAADLLKITPAMLIRTLNKEFPEVFQELDLQNFENINSNSQIDDEESKSSTPRNISELVLQDVELTFSVSPTERFSTYYISKEKLPDTFNISQDIVAVIEPNNKTTAGDYLLVLDKDQNIYTIGKVKFDQFLNLYYILNKSDQLPVFLNDVVLVGKIIGYCPFTELASDKLHVESINSII